MRPSDEGISCGEGFEPSTDPHQQSVKLPRAKIGSILNAMKIATGKVVGGKVLLDGAKFEECSSVTVLASDEERGVTITPEEEPSFSSP